MSSATACSGETHRLPTGRTRRSTIASSGGVFDRIFAALAAEGGPPSRLMIDATHLKAHRTAASLLKKGLSPLYRPHQGRAEREAPRRLRRAGARPGPAAHRGPGERSSRRGADAAKTPACQGTDRRPGGRQRPLQGRTRSAWHRRLHPLDALAQAAHPARPNALPTTPPHREHVRPPQGLAAHRHALRPLPSHLPRSHHPRRYRYILARSMSPEPRWAEGPRPTPGPQGYGGEPSNGPQEPHLVRFAERNHWLSLLR